MKKLLLFFSAVAFVSSLSSCELFPLTHYDFSMTNRSSYLVSVHVDMGGVDADKDFVLLPGENKDVTVYYQDELDYSYAPTDLVDTGAQNHDTYYFWDKGKPRPF